MVAMAFGKSTGFEHREWRFLVDLSRRHLEPRLVAELAGKVRAGGTVEVGGGLTVHPEGIHGMSVSLAWSEVAGTSAKDDGSGSTRLASASRCCSCRNRIRTRC